MTYQLITLYGGVTLVEYNEKPVVLIHPTDDKSITTQRHYPLVNEEGVINHNALIVGIPDKELTTSDKRVQWLKDVLASAQFPGVPTKEHEALKQLDTQEDQGHLSNAQIDEWLLGLGYQRLGEVADKPTNRIEMVANLFSGGMKTCVKYKHSTIDWLDITVHENGHWSFTHDIDEDPYSRNKVCMLSVFKDFYTQLFKFGKQSKIHAQIARFTVACFNSYRANIELHHSDEDLSKLIRFDTETGTLHVPTINKDIVINISPAFGMYSISDNTNPDDPRYLLHAHINRSDRSLSKALVEHRKLSASLDEDLLNFIEVHLR